MDRPWPKVCVFLLALGTPALYAELDGPPLFSAGATNCPSCHRGSGFNTGPGRVSIRTRPYTPGVKQAVLVTIEDPDARRWGFQLLARMPDNPNQQAGSFTVTDDIRVQCFPPPDAPCEGRPEFASHRRSSTNPTDTPPGSHTFEVEWTPPARDVGEVAFSVNANAANNNNANTGDRIYQTSTRLSPATCNLTGRPTINAGGVVNAATFRPGISLNGLVSIFGSGFAAPNERLGVGRLDLVEGRLPREFGCVTVFIAGAPAPLVYLQQDQINVQAPSIVASGPVSAQVVLNFGRTNQVMSEIQLGVPMAEWAPTLFTFNGRSVAARHVDFAFLANPSVVAGATPARPGEVVLLYGTGFGATEPFLPAGQLAAGAIPIRDLVTVTIGGVTMGPDEVLYAGLAPGFAGLYQFNVRVPASAPDGDVPVSMRVRGAETQTGVTIPVRR